LKLDTILKSLLDTALQSGNKTALEHYLICNSNLPGVEMRHDLLNEFAGLVGEIVTQPDPPVAQLEKLLDGWAAEDITANEPRQILACAAVRSYGRVAVVRPDWWQDEITKLHDAAHHSNPNVREAVITALQAMLMADEMRTRAALTVWLNEANSLVKQVAETVLKKN
jgi:hypothetical protein